MHQLFLVLDYKLHLPRTKRRKIFVLCLIFNRIWIVRHVQIVSAFDLVFHDMTSILRVEQEFLYAL